MFQYAAALILRSTSPVILTSAEENPHSARDYRKLLFKGLNQTDLLDLPRIVLDSYIQWDPTMFKFPGDVAIKGYFQYLPAIESAIPLIRNNLTNILTTYRDSLRKKYSFTNPTHLGFMHVRRGDYLSFPDYWPVQTEEYYSLAITHIPTVSRWIVLSDDIEWCKTQALFSLCEIIDEPDELIGLALMSLCHGGAVIANSTYSWWGAMLGAHESGAPVVYPSKWLKNVSPNLFPRTWIRI